MCQTHPDNEPIFQGQGHSKWGAKGSKKKANCTCTQSSFPAATPHFGCNRENQENEGGGVSRAVSRVPSPHPTWGSHGPSPSPTPTSVSCKHLNCYFAQSFPAGWGRGGGSHFKPVLYTIIKMIGQEGNVLRCFFHHRNVGGNSWNPEFGQQRPKLGFLRRARNGCES